MVGFETGNTTILALAKTLSLFIFLAPFSCPPPFLHELPAAWVQAEQVNLSAEIDTLMNGARHVRWNGQQQSGVPSDNAAELDCALLSLTAATLPPWPAFLL